MSIDVAAQMHWQDYSRFFFLFLCFFLPPYLLHKGKLPFEELVFTGVMFLGLVRCGLWVQVL